MTCKMNMVDSVDKVDTREWNQATKGPYFSHEWFRFVEAMTEGELQPRYLTRRLNGRLTAVLPAFIPKTHMNTYGNYLMGRFRDRLLKLRPFRRRPLVCYAPHAGGAYLLSDNRYPEDVLQEMVTALEDAAIQGGNSEVAFLCIKENESEWTRLLKQRGYHRVYLNSVGIITNHYSTFDDYLKRLSPRNRKTVKGDLRAFRKCNGLIDTWTGDGHHLDTMMQLVGNIDRRYPSIQRDFSKWSLETCFHHMRPYRKHYAVSTGDAPIGCLTHFEKDRLINTYAMGLDFEKVHSSRAYFNLLYYHTIREMIVRKAPYVNFNQMAYTVKESRGCRLVPQYMYIKVWKNRAWMTLWLRLLNHRYRRKFAQEYARNKASHRRSNPRQQEGA
jgi:hypothetical protein